MSDKTRIKLMEAKTHKQSASLSKKVSFARPAKCFVCAVDMENSPDLAMGMDNYPIPLYVKVFNSFAKLLAIRDSQKRIVQLPQETAKTSVVFCGTCHGQVMQLYRLSNSAHRKAKSTQEQIQLLTTLLRFKLRFAKRNNSKIRHIVTAHADPAKYHINGYWHLRETELVCAKQMNRIEELSSTLTGLDISKLTASRGIYDESNYFLAACELEVEDDTSPGGGEDNPCNTRFTVFGDFDEDDDIGMMVHTGRIAPIELVQCNLGQEFSNSETQIQSDQDQTGSGYDQMAAPIFNVPVGEIKPPRKQILASRVGVSSKAPVIKTIIRDESGAIKETGELLNPIRTYARRTSGEVVKSDGSDNEAEGGPTGETEDEEEECPCPICNKKFPSRKNMIGHLYAHRKPFCEVCRQYFQNEDIYKSHNKSRHNGGPEVCFVCHAVFKDRNKLVSHLRVHKNANTYRCSVPGCTEAFKSKVDSIAHLRKCPFLGSCSSISISSPTHQPSSDEDGDGKAQHNSKSSEDEDEANNSGGSPFTMEEVEEEMEVGPTGQEQETNSSASVSEGEEVEGEMEEVEMGVEED